MSFPQLNKDYDIADENIKCNADKLSAKIYLIKGYRILAYSKETAKQIAEEYINQ